MNTLREIQTYSSKNMILNTEHTVRIPRVRCTSGESPERTGSQEHNAEMRSQEVNELSFSQDWFTRLRLYTAPQIPVHTSFILLAAPHELRTPGN